MNDQIKSAIIAIGLGLSMSAQGEIPKYEPPQTFKQAVKQELGANQYGETCFFQYETPAGMNKICYYSCLSGTVAITLDGLKLCPLSIQR